MSKQDALISCPAPGETAGNVNSADSVSAAGKTTSAAGTAPEKKTISDKKLLEVKNICVQFGSHRHPFTAVDDVSFDIYQGETFGLVGESGSGKTTIGRAIIRINPITKGEILFDGKRISGKLSREEDQQVTRDIQMIFQDPMSSLNERAKVGYIVAEGLYAPGNRYTEEERNEKVKKALLDVGLLPEFASRFPHEFSGGQRQRIGIARALVMDPKFIVADLTYLFIAHDLSVVRFICDRIAVIHKGKIVELSESEELFRHPLHPYTKALLSAIPQPDPEVEKHKELLVYDPSMHDYSIDKPVFEEILPGHFVYGNKKELDGYRKEVGLSSDT